MTTLAELNDNARQGKAPDTTRMVLTRGVNTLSVELLLELNTRVREFDDFTEGNDPNGEHDFGALNFADEKYFWKIDYYEKEKRASKGKDFQYGANDPLDTVNTVRVLTIMRADEY